MKKSLMIAAVGALCSTTFLGTGPIAEAAAARDGNCDPGEFCIYHNSDQQGSVSDFDRSIPDYGTEQPTCWDYKGPGKGRGDCVKNDAASAWNRTGNPVTIYFNSDYGGQRQTFAPGDKTNLDDQLKNDNAAHRLNDDGTRSNGGGSGGNLRDERNDFQFPGADTMYLPEQDAYITYGASQRAKGFAKKLSVPYTISGSGNTPESSARVDGDAFKGFSPTWAKPGANIWTPGAFTKVKNGTRYYYLFFTAPVKNTENKHCVGVANSTSPTGGFTAQPDPLVCPGNKRWAIDADVSTGPNGAVWMTFRDGGRANGGDSALSAVLLSFKPNGRVVKETTPKVIFRGSQVSWESVGDPSGVRVLENPSAFWDSRSQRWYLFYSGNEWRTSRYATGVATCGAELADDLCSPMPGPKRAYFSFFSTDERGFRDGLPEGTRLKKLPGNKRGVGAMDVYLAKDGTPWVTWNYISDSWNGTKDGSKPRKSRLGQLVLDRSGDELSFTVRQR